VISLEKKYGEQEMVVLMNASLLYREKKYDECLHLLQEYIIKQNPKNSLMVELSLAQIQLSRGCLQDALKVLSGIESIKHMPALVATQVSLYVELGDISSALLILDSALNYWSSFLSKNEQDTAHAKNRYMIILKEIASFNAIQKKWNAAYNSYLLLYKMNPNDYSLLSNLVLAASHFDPQLAEKHAKFLPIPQFPSPENLEALESLPPARGLKSTLRPTSNLLDDKAGEIKNKDEVKEKEKKEKKEKKEEEKKD